MVTPGVIIKPRSKGGLEPVFLPPVSSSEWVLEGQNQLVLTPCRVQNKSPNINCLSSPESLNEVGMSSPPPSAFSWGKTGFSPEIMDEFGIGLWVAFLVKWKAKWKFIEGSWSPRLLVLSLVWAHNSFSADGTETCLWINNSSLPSDSLLIAFLMTPPSNNNLRTCLSIL